MNASPSRVESLIAGLEHNEKILKSNPEDAEARAMVKQLRGLLVRLKNYLGKYYTTCPASEVDTTHVLLARIENALDSM